MPHATFARHHDHRTSRGGIVAYKAGWSGSIPKAHHDSATAAGALVAEVPNGTAGEQATGEKPAKPGPSTSPAKAD